METKRATRKHFNSLSDCEAFVDNLTYANMRNWLISFLMEEQPEKIVLTREQFEAFFKVRGFTSLDGEREVRGRKKKEGV